MCSSVTLPKRLADKNVRPLRAFHHCLTELGEWDRADLEGRFGPRSGASGILTMMEHSGTHIDALCHQACDLTLHGGVKVDEVERSDGYRELGAETMPPLLGRGVLLDVAGAKGVAQLPQHYAITDQDLVAAARAAAVTVRPGDVLLVRTGYATS